MKNIKEVEILENKLLKRIENLNNILLERSGEIDENAIDSSLKDAYNHIADILVNGYRYQPREVENILVEVIDQTKKDLCEVSEKGRNREIEDKLFSIYDVTKKEVGKFLELDDLSEEKDIDRLSTNITNRSDEVSKDKSDKVASVHRMLEDEISLEMKNRLKSRLRIYDDPRGEEAYNEISNNYINRRLIEDIIDRYQEGSKQIGDIMQRKVENIVEDIKQEYKREMAKGNQEKEESTKDKLGLSDLVNSPEEAFEASKQREEKEHEIDDKNKDGLITHVID